MAKANATKKNVLIMAGGTGGHVIPAISVARELMLKGYQVHWLGSVHGIENDLVPDAGYPLHRVSVSGLRGNGLKRKLLAPVTLLRALWQTFKVYRRVKPALALGMGGFASGPGGVMAKLTGVPLLIHEQNAIAGLTNHVLRKRAHTLMQAFAGTFSDVAGVKTVGNPVRASINQIEAPASRLANRQGPLNVLVVGGSLGAVAINDVVIETLAVLKDKNVINLWHQTGERNYQGVKDAYDQAGIADVKVSAFISDMASAFSWADLLICRSGALTVSELMNAGVASILVPYPYAVDDHQTVNGNFLVRAGGAILMDQNTFTVESLSEKLMWLHQHREEILRMSQAARTLAKPESAKVVSNYCIEAMNDRSK